MPQGSHGSAIHRCPEGIRTTPSPLDRTLCPSSPSIRSPARTQSLPMPRRRVALIAVADSLPPASQGAQEDRRRRPLRLRGRVRARSTTLTGSRRLRPQDPTPFIATASLLWCTSTPCGFLDHTTSSRLASPPIPPFPLSINKVAG